MKEKFRNKILAVVLNVFVILIFLLSCGNKKENIPISDNSTKVNEVKKETKKDVDEYAEYYSKNYPQISINELEKVYKANEIDFDNKYKGKILKVFGSVFKVSKGTFGGIYVEMKKIVNIWTESAKEVKEGFGIKEDEYDFGINSTWDCELKDSQNEKAAKLKKEDQLVLIGKCDRYRKFSDCEIFRSKEKIRDLELFFGPLFGNSKNKNQKNSETNNTQSQVSTYGSMQIATIKANPGEIVNLREKPNVNSTVLVKLNPGEKIGVTNYNAHNDGKYTWASVTWSSNEQGGEGTSGYVANEFLELDNNSNSVKNATVNINQGEKLLVWEKPDNNSPVLEELVTPEETVEIINFNAYRDNRFTLAKIKTQNGTEGYVDNKFLSIKD